MRAIADFLALRRNTALLLGALLVAGTGDRLWLGFAPKYIETLGGGVLVIGIFDALQTMGSFLGARLWPISPQANFITAACLGGSGALWFWRFVYRAPQLRLAALSP